MARTQAVIFCAAWNDADFTMLSPAAQHRYFQLLSQPDLTHLGIIPFRPTRWASLAADDSIENVRSSINELVAARFVLVDEDTGELCIRSYVRNDGVYRNPKVLIAAEGAIGQVRSPVIRAALRGELERIASGDLSDVKCDSQPGVRATLADMTRALGGTDAPPDTPSDTPPRGGAVVDAVGLHAPTPSPATTPAPAAEEVRKQRQNAGMPCGPAWSDDRLQKVVGEALTQTPGATTTDADLVWTTLAQFAADTRIRAEAPGLFLHRGLDRLTQVIAARRSDERRKRERKQQRIVEADARAAATEPTPEWLARKAAMQGKPAA